MSLQPAPATFPAPLVDLMADLACVLFRRHMCADGSLSYVWFSPNVETVFGFAPAEMSVAHTGALNALHWADRDDHVREIRRSAATLQPCHELFRIISDDGQTHWLRGSARPQRHDDGSIIWDGAWLDITQWMRAEHHFQTVMDHAEDCILTVDCNSGIEWANAATERLFDCHEGGLRGQCLMERIQKSCPPGRPSCHGDDMLSCFQRGTSEVTAIHSDGSLFPFEMTVSEVRTDGRLSLIVIGRDISRRKQTESVLAETEQRLRLMFEAAPVGILVADSTGRIRQSNPAFHIMCGQDTDAIDGAALSDFIPVANLPDLENSVEGVFCREISIANAQNTLKRWRMSGSHFHAAKDDPHPSILLLIEDITDYYRSAEERRQLERVLTEGQKLEALGRLAGGVAHELNNMLGPILMGAEMLIRSAALDDKNRGRCDRIIEAAKHGRDIVRGVLAYCRQERQDLSAIDLVPVVGQFSELVRSVLPPTTRLDLSITCGQAMVMGNAGQITQILLNLANNGRDAMDGKGTLQVHLGCSDTATPQAIITISDTGCGMSEEVAARIFDPFFTTKPVGQGTGLGLSVVHGLVTAMGGAIAVTSAIGHGSTFTITLPVADMACPTP
ncbi:PAS domain-containing sensor histidine kinase [Magnetospirillum sulfuroxidans]|uniref:histidine kinase n=1 Tax=Magnetospirillum sulfuroxidans TaxID=611300 RepID=A0ABS5I8T6_9PROT|nr:PAS domain S-box protein [Magnetospirillum sulfuroxidans]MBR9970729.1 PAS domain S-box protein [Magnetospirillum sulfuroxidans]